MNLPTRWSYSSLSTWESCPAKWHYSYMTNLPSKPSAAMLRGSRLHADCENYVRGNLLVLPFELAKVSIKINDYKNRGAKPEEVWLLDNTWLPNAAMPWIKAIVDIHWLSPKGDILHVIDYKSGREYPEHREQLELYGIMGMMVYPQVKKVDYGALYLDSGHVSNEGTVLRGDMLDAKVVKWTERANKLMNDREWKPTPSTSACNWCDYNHKRGGPCKDGV